MNMDESQYLFGVGTPVTKPSVSLVGALVLLYAVWLFGNAWSINLVAYGIQTVGLIPPNIPEWLVYFFAASIQAGPAFLGLLTPLFFKRLSTFTLMVWLLVVIIVAASVSFEAFHAVLAQVKNSIGVGLERAERSEILRLHKQVTDISAELPSLYINKLASFETLANNAAAGRDRTRDAKCGPICRENWDKFGEAKAKFSDLELNGVPAVENTQDIREAFMDLEGRFRRLESSLARLDDFYHALDGSAAPRSIRNAITSLHNQLLGKERKFANMSSITVTSLSVDQTWDIFQRITEGKWPRREAILALAYGILPFLSVLVTSIFIGRVRAHLGPELDPVGTVKDQLHTEEQAQKILERLRGLREKNFRNWLAANFRRWGPAPA